MSTRFRHHNKELPSACLPKNGGAGLFPQTTTLVFTPEISGLSLHICRNYYPRSVTDSSPSIHHCLSNQVCQRDERTVPQAHLHNTYQDACYWYRYHSGYGLSQWETTLQCNVVSHWLSQYPEWSLKWYPTFISHHNSHTSNFAMSSMSLNSDQSSTCLTDTVGDVPRIESLKVAAGFV